MIEQDERGVVHDNPHTLINTNNRINCLCNGQCYQYLQERVNSLIVDRYNDPSVNTRWRLLPET